MVKAKFTWNGSVCSLEVKGHACYADPGQPDIVCSAVSALAYTFAGSVQTLVGKCTIKDQPGDYYCEIDITRDAFHMKKLSTILQIVYIGIHQVALTYPENVSVELLWNGLGNPFGNG